MPGDTGMTYPYPYKTGDGEENVKISNLIVTGNSDVNNLTVHGTGSFDDNVVIEGDLTVDGTISGVTVAPHFTATDNQQQYRVNSGSEFDLMHTTSANPTFNLKNNLGSTSSSTLVTDTINNRVINASMANLQTIQSNDINTVNTFATNETVTNSNITNAIIDTSTIDTATVTNATITNGVIDQLNVNDIILNTTQDLMSVSVVTDIAGSRGVIRSFSDAFGLDLKADGPNKSIKLSTDNGVRLSVEDDTVEIYSTTESTDETTGALIVRGGVAVQKNLNIQENWTFEQLKFVFRNLGVDLMTLTPSSLTLITGNLDVTVGTITCQAGGIRTNAGNITAGRLLGQGGTMSCYQLNADLLVSINNVHLKSGGGLNYDFILPNSIGSSGQALTSNGSGSMLTWSQFLKKLTLNVPSFMSVTGSPIDSVAEGTLTIDATTTGTGIIVLNTNPTISGGLNVSGLTTTSSLTVTGTSSLTGNTTINGTLSVLGTTTVNTLNAGNVTCLQLNSSSLATGNVTAGDVTCLALQSTTLQTGTIQAGNCTLGAVQAGNLSCLSFLSTNVATGAIEAVSGFFTANVTTGSLNTGAVVCGNVTAGTIQCVGLTLPTGGISVVVGGITVVGGNMNVAAGTISTGTLDAGCTLTSIGGIKCHQLDCEPYLGINGLINCAFLRCITSALPAGSGSIVSEGEIVCEGTTDSTSTSTGCIRAWGGLGVAKNVYVGGELHVLEAIYGTSGTLTVSDVLQVSAQASCFESFKCLLDDGHVGQQLYNLDVDSSYHFFDCFYNGTSILASSINTCGAFYKDQTFLSLIGTTVAGLGGQTLSTLWKTNLDNGETTFNQNVIINKHLTLGVTGGQSGYINLKGVTSGTVSIKVDNASGTFDFILPTTVGTAGQVLTSNGGTGPMTWSNAGSVTSVAMSVPSFLTVSGSPITTTGTLAVSYSGTALPVLNGGTGTTTSTGTGSVVLSSSPTLVNPTAAICNVGTLNGTGTTQGPNDSLLIGPSGSQNLFIDRNRTGGNFIFGYHTVIDTTESYRYQFYNNSTDRKLLFAILSRGSGSGTDRLLTAVPLNMLDNSPIVMVGSSSGSVAIKPNTTGSSWDFVLPTGAGTAGQVLTSNGGTGPMTWSNAGSVTSVAMSVPSFLTVSGSPITTTGTLAVSYSGTALPVLNGGTGTTTSTGTGSVVLSSSPTLVNPTAAICNVGTLNGTGTTQGPNDSLLIGPSGSQNLFIDRNRTGGNFIFGYHTVIDTTESYRYQFYNNSTDRKLLFAILSRGSGSGTDRLLTAVPFHSTVTTGTAPFNLQSTTLVSNLNSQYWNGATYSQGSWTPSVVYESGSSVSRTVTGQVGKYVTNGSQTTISFWIEQTYSSMTDFVFRIGNLPIASCSTSGIEGYFLGSYQILTSGAFTTSSLYYLLPNAVSQISLTSSPSWSPYNNNPFTAASSGTLRVKGTITYINNNLS